MDIINEIGSLLPELLKLGGWGAMLILLITRLVVTKAEKDEAIAVERDRIKEKDKQIEVLRAAVKEGDANMERLAVAWEAAIKFIALREKE